MSGIDILKDLLVKMKHDQLKIWEKNCPYSGEQKEMYEFTIEHCIQEIESQRYLEDFTLNFFDGMFELAKTVYKEKPDVHSFINYVEELVKKDLEG